MLKDACLTQQVPVNFSALSLLGGYTRNGQFDYALGILPVDRVTQTQQDYQRMSGGFCAFGHVLSRAAG